MSPEERAEWAARRPVPPVTIPRLQEALRRRGGASATVCAEILADVDDVGLDRLIGCGWTDQVQAALLREHRRRRAVADIAEVPRRFRDLDTDPADVYAGHSSTEQETA